ncbi:aldehyde dehydrogenase (plasmid) [Deinococcus aetherius]|uniref:Aldehyde dehydrogenase n=2 Tax=Deinococcus aetherius TaxID=200252 RepID=A0ABM8AJ97_9DEIO|nr:aldehyde dehydrogenase [Deinococcus aetherius]
MLLGENWVDRAPQMDVRDPQDGRLIDRVPKATLLDVELALSVAWKARRIARALPTHERVQVLSLAAELIGGRQEMFARTIASEGIKTIREARKEAARCAATLRLCAEEARRLGGEIVNFDQRPGSEGRIGYWTREPVGVIVAITPFNDPLNLVAHKVGPAIAAGNAVIVKPHEQTPLSALGLAEVLREAGLPPGVLQVLTGDGTEIGPALVSDPRVRMVSFTGGVGTGQQIARLAGLKRLAMELGSNCPTLVMDDADLDLAVPSILSGAYWAAGQNCLHVQRVLVQDAVYAEVRSRLVEGARGYRVGDKLSEDTDMGPLVSEVSARRVETLVQEAVTAGATLLTGGTRDGAFFAPTLVENVAGDLRLYQEEVYGPVTVLERVDDYDEAVRRANSVSYGLQGAIFTGNVNLAFRAVRDLDCGAVIINDSTDYRVDGMPFGGVKDSGLGREGVQFTVREMSEVKLACFRVTPA